MQEVFRDSVMLYRAERHVGLLLHACAGVLSSITSAEHVTALLSFMPFRQDSLTVIVVWSLKSWPSRGQAWPARNHQASTALPPLRHGHQLL